MAPYYILSLDGGGIRAVFTARLLARLDQQVAGFLDQVALFAGTSSGGILALGLAAGLSPDALVRLYRDNGAQIFDDSWLDNLKDLGNIGGAQYDNQNLQRILTEVFAERNLVTLDDLLPKRVLIPTFDLDDGQDSKRKPGKPRSWKPKFFHNYPGTDSDGHERLIDVALRTSAAPTYFPTYGRYVDGGVVANNPGMSALAQALNAKSGQQDLPDIRLLSLGVGTNPTFIAGVDHDWGYAQWAQPIIGLMLDGVTGVTDYECAQILGSNYFRLNAVLDEVIPLDAYQQVDQLLRYADATDISAAVAWIRAHMPVAPSDVPVTPPTARRPAAREK